MAKPTIVRQEIVDGREAIYLWTTGKELFSVVKPDVGEDVPAQLRKLAREAARQGLGLAMRAIVTLREA